MIVLSVPRKLPADAGELLDDCQAGRATLAQRNSSTAASVMMVTKRAAAIAAQEAELVEDCARRPESTWHPAMCSLDDGRNRPGHARNSSRTS